MATAVLCPLPASSVTVAEDSSSRDSMTAHLSAVLLSLQGGSSHPAAIACAFQQLLGVCHEVSILHTRLTVMAKEFITMMLKWKPCDSLAVATLTLLHTAQVWCSDSFKKLQQQKKKTKGKYLAGYSFCLSQAVINKNISNFPDKQWSFAFLVIRNSSPWLPTVFSDNYLTSHPQPFFFFNFIYAVTPVL